ncbi:ABC transporter substrate-binding protein [Streptomyces cylindrosporus]|uniref:Probable sugar-binding periplasmic protein n=1 Tax=Streptomyces cylindrosporus TaxID=2927583 RepID=A0ABS9YQH1_9ACTN|nr:extracellular solute-binding protein [Streptomyces cylindrosporus]MCI3278891.1 extracellular solute-binding protein [Streptomyces cylindrosporus]
MRNFRGRPGMLAAMLAFGLAAVSACSGGSTAAPSGKVANTEGAAPKGVTLTLWHNTADSKALLDLYKAYEKKSGNTIKLVDIPADSFPSTVQTKWATGARPDILEWHGNRTDALSLNAAGTMLDLSKLPFVAKEGDLATVSGSVGGKTYAATIGALSISGIFYNKQVFAKAGLQPPQTYDDLAADCKVLKAKTPGVAPLFEAGGSQWPPQILSAFNYLAESNENQAYDTSILNGKAKLSDADGPFVAALTAYDKLRTAGCFNSDRTTAKWEDQMKAVLDGKAAMVAQNSDSIGLLNSDANGDTAKVDASVGFVGVSATKAVANYAPSPLGTYYVPSTGDSEKERAAVDFIEFATGAGYADYIKEAKIIPTLSGTTTPELQGLLQDVKKAYDQGATLSFNSEIPGFGNFGPESSKLLADQESPQQVAAKMQAFYQQAAAAAKQ